MIHLGTDVNIDLSTSCTKDQAVMKLLGWSQGIMTRKEIELPASGSWLDQLSAVSHHTMNLTEELKALHERARQEYLAALPPEAYEDHFDPDRHFTSPEAIDTYLEKARNLEDMGKLIERAHAFAMDIEDELDKGELSVLRVDQDATEKSGITHLTLRSLDQWRVRYDASAPQPTVQTGHPVVADARSDSRPSTEMGVASADPSALDSASSNKKENYISSLNLLLELFETKEISKREISIYITLALAVEAIVKRFPNHGDPNGKPNINMVAKFIADAQHDPDGKPLIEGQGLESVRKRLSRAMGLLQDLRQYSR